MVCSRLQKYLILEWQWLEVNIDCKIILPSKNENKFFINCGTKFTTCGGTFHSTFFKWMETKMLLTIWQNNDFRPKVFGLTICISKRRNVLDICVVSRDREGPAADHSRRCLRNRCALDNRYWIENYFIKHKHIKHKRSSSVGWPTIIPLSGTHLLFQNPFRCEHWRSMWLFNDFR